MIYAVRLQLSGHRTPTPNSLRENRAEMETALPDDGGSVPGNHRRPP